MVSKNLKNKIAQGEGYYTEFNHFARNAILANIMQRAGFIEKLGTGITRIKQEIEKAGLPKPVFHYNYFFAVEFTRVKKVEKSSEKSS
ncbi:MAG TPA: hypothetical protein ENN90_02875, partial [Mariniphaga anaerophila]|nr:hypothetical protein [Mariniphaga anaerophila]